MSDARRAIPSVERLLSSAALADVLAREPRARVIALLRDIQDDLRQRAAADASADPAWYACEVDARIQRANEYSLRAVINASGVILHTNLGRAPLAGSALDAMIAVAFGYSNLEYDISAGERGSRYTHCADLLCSLTGADAALVVNNNAAALLLALNTIALEKPVIISRGELVEIGGSFRIAEIAKRSGVQLIEVGATNRTHRADYAHELPNAAAILKVHPSNYQMSGFVADVPADELARLAHAAGIPLIHDLGSGLLESLEDLGLPHEPTAREALAGGADLVTMSGDKLLGGPQAGLIVGRAQLVSAMQNNALCRALRVDKLTIASLEATLQCYARGTARQDIPVLRMIAATRTELRDRAENFAESLAEVPLEVAVIDGASTIGGGSYPGVELPTSLVTLQLPSASAAHLESRLRMGQPSVIARVSSDRVLIDLRTVLLEQEGVLARRIRDVA